VACSDGAYAKKTATSSHAQVFASGLVCNIVATGVGPVDGHPALLSSYRSELSGILAALYIVFHICQHYNITMGQMTLYCDNKGALRNSFCPIKEGITPYLSTDHDLIELVQHLLSLIPITIATEWVKGNYTGRNREYKHDLNDKADCLARDYQQLQMLHYTIPCPIKPPILALGFFGITLS
jgi:hypothetical protein